MRHRKRGATLGRTRGPRQALVLQLTRALIRVGHVTTTKAKAAAVRPTVERMVTLAKRATLANRRRLIQQLNQPFLANKLLTTYGTKYRQRAGGYTRIIRLGTRAGDRAPLVRLEFVE